MNAWSPSRRFVLESPLGQPLRRAKLKVRGSGFKGFDAEMEAVCRRVLRRNSNTIDVGCHIGTVLNVLAAIAPRGHHIGVEPLPHLAEKLKSRYRFARKIEVVHAALAEDDGEATFQFVTSNPAYSGLRRREYPSDHETIEQIVVPVRRLDDLVPAGRSIDFIKIDVEGGELGVLCGATATLHRDRPFVVFEHGRGAADRYDTTPDDVFGVMADAGLKLSLMADWLAGRQPMTLAHFVDEYDRGENYYFLAHV